MTTPESFDPRSHDAAADRLTELLRLFPEIRTEGGKLDFDRLKLALGEAVDVGKERYGLSWPGKAECFRTIQAPSLGTLLPKRDESVNFDSTENLIIEGDNLEVLKLLQKPYLGQVKMIYIDPPYNTGNDFIYPDNYTESLKTYLQYTGQVDAEGRRFGTNTDTDGRFHSKWLNMMYPRLYLARNLLREDGVLFLSIDDNEISSAATLLREVFGEDNLLAVLIWNKQHSQQQGLFKRYHEYVLCVARNAQVLGNIGGGEGVIDAGALKKISRGNPASDFTFPEGVRFEAQDGFELQGTFGDSEKVTVVNGRFRCEDGKTADSVTLRAGWTQRNQMETWFAGKETRDTKGQKVLEFYFNSAGKLKCRKERTAVTPPTLLPEYGMVSAHTGYLADLLGAAVFPNPKPVQMLRDFIGWFVGEGDIVLDFFAGSGTTGEAVLRSQVDGKLCRYILVQLPEPLDIEKPEQHEAALYCDGLAKPRTVCEITKERMRRVDRQLDWVAVGADGDSGFRVFQLAESNFTTWDAAVPHDTEALVQQMELHVDHIREGRTEEDILFELLLKSGFPLSTTIETLALAGKTVFSVAGGALLVCLDRDLTLEAIRAIADAEPQRVILLDQAFRGNDQLKANAVQTFKTKGVVKFQTV